VHLEGAVSTLLDCTLSPVLSVGYATQRR